MCFSKQDIPILFNNLGRPLDLANTDHSLWSDKCDYQELKEISNLSPTGNNLTLLQLIIRSLLGKQNELNLMFNELHKKEKFTQIIVT